MTNGAYNTLSCLQIIYPYLSLGVPRTQLTRPQAPSEGLRPEVALAVVQDRQLRL